MSSGLTACEQVRAWTEDDMCGDSVISAASLPKLPFSLAATNSRSQLLKDTPSCAQVLGVEAMVANVRDSHGFRAKAL